MVSPTRGFLRPIAAPADTPLPLQTEQEKSRSSEACVALGARASSVAPAARTGTRSVGGGSSEAGRRGGGVWPSAAGIGRATVEGTAAREWGRRLAFVPAARGGSIDLPRRRKRV